MNKAFHQCLALLCVFTLLLPAGVGAAEAYRNSDQKFQSQINQVNAYQVAVQKKTKKLKKKRRYKKRLSLKQRRLAQQRKIASLINQDGFNAAGPLSVSSKKALVVNQLTGEVVYGKNSHVITPIASVTKLMTAMIALDMNLPMNDYLVIGSEDVDHLKNTRSRLKVGTVLRRRQMLELSLMSSENRAAAALSRYYPGGRAAFIHAMNTKAAMLGMQDTRFYDSTGLDSRNVSTASDLVKMVNAAHQYDEIRQYTTTANDYVYANGAHNPLKYVNTNLLVRQNNEWDIGLSKTGYIREAGRCLVMQADIDGEPMVIVLLDSDGKYTRLGDANRVRKWFAYHQERTFSMFDGHSNVVN